MRLAPRLATVALLLGLALASACSKSDSGNPTGPPSTGSLELNSGNIGPAGAFVHTFAKAGTFPYHCAIHAMMTGSVTVVSGGPATASVSIVNSSASGFSPPSVTVGVGGQVTWVNNDGVTHTVTSD